ncbi:right-handed parallel beta-helix repeat-containing protein [Nocardiopsis sp. HNM0947]|uniref:Right-handed parallel beta-helix repeat-containing protein n=1 Tax=Nocardiopsis coralli TaxID=2772213 RepID=A0ABR9PAA1_9ACTN|nr:right-handed parallel beta-helix repeat-containing protein [Nocardiopsis coralli]MBE3000756.1 right-handed parallel beta-helix repeat-containing protein [Nocardiopsis coralli]
MRLHPTVLQVPLALLCAALVACSQQPDPGPSDPPVGADADPEEADESSPPPEDEQPETPVGWATEPAPADDEGDGDTEASGEPEDGGGVTGGGDADPVTATDADELSAHLEEDGPLVVELQGAIELDGDVQVPSDTTLVASDEGAALTGGGLVVDGADNVVLTGLSFDADGTAVAVRGGASNVWVHRSTFTGDDGTLLEIADGADHVTVAWNRFTEAASALTIGGADDEPGALHVTVHHNHFDGTAGHHPRARNAEHVHVFNNYFRSNGEYGVESAHASNVLAEGNYFQNSELSVTPDEDEPGNIEARDNLLVDTPQPEIRGEVPDPPYVYELDPTTEVPDLVADGAGVPE